MSSLDKFIESMKAKVTLLEQSIAQAVNQAEQWSNNHVGLLGMMQATKEALDEAVKIAAEIAPSTPVTEVLNIADTVVDDLDALEQNSGNN